jgi:hypothetical protein
MWGQHNPMGPRASGLFSRYLGTAPVPATNAITHDSWKVGQCLNAKDAEYLEIVTQALSVCIDYRPKFGQGGDKGFSVDEFQALYRADPFYSWFGLDSPLMYAAHRAAGGMTSVYRQIGIGCQWLFQRVLQDQLSLDADSATWSYTIPGAGGKERRLSLDGRMPLEKIADRNKRARVAHWLQEAAQRLKLTADKAATLEGAVFEVRQGYKSQDSKRQNADVANAAHAHAHNYLPIAAVLSLQIPKVLIDRYRSALWLILVGSTNGTPFDSTYVFMREVVGYDLAGFFERNAGPLRTTIQLILRSLLSEPPK